MRLDWPRWFWPARRLPDGAEAATVEAEAPVRGWIVHRRASHRTRLRGWVTGLDAEHWMRRLDLKVGSGALVLELKAPRHVADAAEATRFAPVAGLRAQPVVGAPDPARQEARQLDSAKEPEGILVCTADPLGCRGRVLDAEIC
ncbi:MAG: hypothetical protein JSW66_09620 [Phycisphaerales bacterium]|nr:MAG: hypothetical protein JSW66_09620 [Phycisphaerales bacterium]